MENAAKLESANTLAATQWSACERRPNSALIMLMVMALRKAARLEKIYGF